MPHIIWYYWSTPKIHDSFTVTSNKKTGLNYFSYSMNHTFLRLGLGSVYYCLVFAVKQKKPYQNATWCLFPIGVLFHQSLWNFFGVKHVCSVIISTKWNYQPFWFWCFFSVYRIFRRLGSSLIWVGPVNDGLSVQNGRQTGPVGEIYLPDRTSLALIPAGDRSICFM